MLSFISLIDSTDTFAGKIVIGLIGAAVALGLNRFIVVYEKHQKNRNIRNLILSDLRAQKQLLKFLKEDIERFLPTMVYGYSSSEKVRFLANRNINTDVIKSQSRLDLFKAFKEFNFQRLMRIERNIKVCEEVNLFDLNKMMYYEGNKLIKELDDKPNALSNVQAFHENEQNRLRTVCVNIDDTIQMINKLIESAKT